MGWNCGRTFNDCLWMLLRIHRTRWNTRLLKKWAWDVAFETSPFYIEELLLCIK